jgi:preprotein translocase subunit SecA
MVRGDLPDLIYKNEDGKFKAIAKDVKERQLKQERINQLLHKH